MNAVSILILLIVFQLILFSVFLFGRENPTRLSNFLLGSFFLSLAINLLNALCFRVHSILINYTHLTYIGAPFAFLLGPLFYLYIISITEENFIPGKKHAIHFLPFVAYVLLLLLRYYFHPVEWKLHYIKTEGIELWRILMPLLNLQVIIYVVAGFKVLRGYRKKIKNTYSSIEKINYSWLEFIFYGLIFLWLADLSRYFAALLRSHEWALIELFFFSGFLVFCYIILYKVITEPAIFSPVVDFAPKKKKSLSDVSNQRYLDQLLVYMENEKPYLSPSITLFDISEQTGIPARSLSDVINSSLNQNFYDFINSYRIKEAEKYLVTKSGETILEILYEVGFNTKSSFNQAFKKHSGMTPTQFKKLQLLDS
jgi:AraC-like DNA-binding protein